MLIALKFWPGCAFFLSHHETLTYYTYLPHLMVALVQKQFFYHSLLFGTWTLASNLYHIQFLCPNMFVHMYGCMYVRGLLEKYPTFGREKETGLLGALDT